MLRTDSFDCLFLYHYVFPLVHISSIQSRLKYPNPSSLVDNLSPTKAKKGAPPPNGPSGRGREQCAEDPECARKRFP